MVGGMTATISVDARGGVGFAGASLVEAGGLNRVGAAGAAGWPDTDEYGDVLAAAPLTEGSDGGGYIKPAPKTLEGPIWSALQSASQNSPALL